MFYRATKLSTGSGLGMYIAKETVEKLGGSISLKSELNIGTKFIIQIPNQNKQLDYLQA
jgi:signal transduction histidine kinase